MKTLPLVRVPPFDYPMKIVLKFLLIASVTGLLMISSPAQILSFIGACALLAVIVVRRRRHSDLSLR